MDNKEMNNQNQNAFNAAENPTPEAQSPVQPAQSDFEQSAPNPEQPAQTFDAQPQQASGGQQSSQYDRWDSNTGNNDSVNSTAQQGFGQAPQQGFDQQQNFNGQNFSQQGQPYNGTTQYGSNGAPVQPEHNLAIATLVLGIASIVFFFGGVSALLSIACGIAGVITSSKAKKAGNTEAIRQIGFVMSLVGVIVGAIIFVACVACTGAIGLGMLNY